MADVYEAKNALRRAGFELNMREVRPFPHVIEARYEDVADVLMGIGYTGKFLVERTIKTQQRASERAREALQEEEDGQLSLFKE